MSDGSNRETNRPPVSNDNEPEEEIDVDSFLEESGFDTESMMLTRRQAAVLLMRERGLKQATIAERLGTSRANVSGIESSARENVEKAHETVAFAKLLSAPVRVEIPANTDLYDVPDLVFDACDDVDMKVSHSAPDLMKLISDGADDAVEGREVRSRLVVTVTTDGTVWVRSP